MAKEGHAGSERNGAPPWKVMVVGPCAAGKSSLKACLSAAGVPVRTVAQEHSHVPYLWQTGSPDVLIYLDVGLATLQRRRRQRWTHAMLDAQHRRLAHARAHAHLVVPTDNSSGIDYIRQRFGKPAANGRNSPEELADIALAPIPRPS